MARPDRPIFIIGCAKSGTTLLSVILSAHTHVGPKPPGWDSTVPQDLMKSLLEDSSFDRIAHQIEKKDVWDRYFPNPAGLRIGKELVLLRNPLSPARTTEFIAALMDGFSQARFLSKQPFNTFRIHVLRQIFPDCRIVCIHRDGRDVVASWGRKQDRWQALGGYEQAIGLMAAKWNEAIDHVETYKQEFGIHTLRYEDLVNDPVTVIKDLLAYCELPFEHIFTTLVPGRRSGNWRHLIPARYHGLVCDSTAANRLRLGYQD